MAETSDRKCYNNEIVEVPWRPFWNAEVGADSILREDKNILLNSMKHALDIFEIVKLVREENQLK